MRSDRDATTKDALDWLARVGVRVDRSEPLAGDVSARHYRRVHLEGGGTAVLALYPEDLLGACARYRATTDLLLAAGVPVPGILATDCAAGRMLLEDAGDATLYDWGRDGDWRELEPYFLRALELTDSIREIDPGTVAGLSPPLDAALLRSELEQTLRLLLVPRGLAGDASCARRLEAALDDLCRRLGDGPRTVCHRDFMARNLIPTGPPPGLAVLDHQDLRVGPRFYDTASLLNDSLFPPLDLAEGWLRNRLQTAADRRAYGRAVVQRALKAAGTFEAFARRGNPRHLPLIPPTLERAAAHLADLPETAELAPELTPLWREIDLLD